MNYKCYVVQNPPTQHKSLLDKRDLTPLLPGEILVKNEYSSINYKDALAGTGKGKILHRFPLVPGIDAAGTVEDPGSTHFKKGQKVFITGCGFGEDIDGGYSEYSKFPSQWTLPVPDNWSTKEIMILGTAGFTAGLCLLRMEQMGISAKNDPIVITGASGGVGMISILLLNRLGYSITAISSKKSLWNKLTSIGAKDTILPESILNNIKPLMKTRWGGAIDNVGGEILNALLPQIQLFGSICSVGMALGSQINTSVFPFILRGVSILGISSTNCPLILRKQVWDRLSSTLTSNDIAQIHTDTVDFNQLDKGFNKLMDNQSFGRILVECKT